MVWFTILKKCSKALVTALLVRKKVVISGSGNVAQYALQKATELGATVISVSGSNGYMSMKMVSTSTFLQMLKKNAVLSLTEYATEKQLLHTMKVLWTYAGNYDICLPCATQNEIQRQKLTKRLVAQGVTLCIRRR